MKKYIALLLCAVLLVSVTACGKDTPKGADNTPSTTQSTVTTTAGEGSTTSVNSSATTTTTTAGTNVPPSTGGTAGSTGTGTPSASTTAPTKTPSSSATGSQPATGGSKPSSSTSAPTTGTTRPVVTEPDVVLPAIGSDIDVTKQKDRIRVSAASYEKNSDGSFTVSLTFKNHSIWITEETDWVEYTCYDKDGNVAQNATKLSIGCIDTKKNVQRTYTFTVPANTAEVRITRSKIVYWTEWS